MNEQIKKRYHQLRRKVVAANKAEGTKVQSAIVDVFVHSILEDEYGKEAVGDIEQYQRAERGSWTSELCVASAQNYKTLTEWRRECWGAYIAARRKGWIDECCAHFIRPRLPPGYWTLDKCKEDAQRFTNGTDWQTHSKSSYGAARKHGWLKECSEHFPVLRKPRGHWTKEACIEDVLQFDNMKLWQKGSAGAHKAAWTNGWLPDCKAAVHAKRRQELLNKTRENYLQHAA